MSDVYTGIKHSREVVDSLFIIRQTITNLAVRAMYADGQKILERLMLEQLVSLIEETTRPEVTARVTPHETVRELRLHIFTQDQLDVCLSRVADEAAQRALNTATGL